jgi:hypothetical protein
LQELGAHLIDVVGLIHVEIRSGRITCGFNGEKMMKVFISSNLELFAEIFNKFIDKSGLTNNS